MECAKIKELQKFISKETFRKYWTTIAPDIILEQDIIREGGDEVTVDIPLTTEFFWPKAD